MIERFQKGPLFFSHQGTKTEFFYPRVSQRGKADAFLGLTFEVLETSKVFYFCRKAFFTTEFHRELSKKNSQPKFELQLLKP
ncbi:hypothetical protein B0E43_02490 [Algoriphagus sp. A40]|nr:hypothetical protein B0E43_02490 [Algoriphagus sp. A40]